MGAAATRFCRRSDGVVLAYAIHGGGPALVFPAWWVSHLEEDWKQPSYQRFFSALAEHFTIVRYDRPGAGLSDRGHPNTDLESEVDTLTTVIDHLGLETPTLCAVSCAGPAAVEYAARNPHRVSKLIFFGSFVSGADVGDQAVRTALESLVLASWGLGSRTIANLFAPDLPTESVKALSRCHRHAASPQTAASLLALTFDTDVIDRAKSVDVPALVLHREGDRTIPASAGRNLAAGLGAGAFVRLAGSAHVPWPAKRCQRSGATHTLGSSPAKRCSEAVPPTLLAAL